MTRLRLVVFDVDGTLIDSQNHIVAAMAAAFEGALLPLPARAEVLSIVGLSLPVAIARLAPSASADTIADMVARYKGAFTAQRDVQDAPPYPGAIETLHALVAEPDTLLGVATGKSRRGLNHLFDLHGMHGFFQTTQVADDHPSKPDPAMLLRALHETGTAARDALMIGDTTFDMEMARAAGLRAIGVSWGYHPREALQAAGAEVIIDSYVDLRVLLDEDRRAR
jgi:phosphoglycolate phosphatase